MYCVILLRAQLLTKESIVIMKRPFSVTLLLWLVLSLTAWSGLRLYTSIQWWSVLLEFASPPGPVYIAASGAIWLIASLVLLWGMWQAKAWIRYALLGTGTALAIWYWCDRLLLQEPGRNWPFVLLMSVLLMIVLTVCVFVPGSKIFFSKRDSDDR